MTVKKFLLFVCSYCCCCCYYYYYCFVFVCFFSRWRIFILCFPFSYCVLFFPVELFEVFDKSPQLWCEDGLAEAVLATYTWCFMQFTLVFTATAQTVPDEKKVFNM